MTSIVHCKAAGRCSGGFTLLEVLVSMAGTGMASGLLLGNTKGPAIPNQTEEPEAKWPEVHVAYLRPKEKYWLAVSVVGIAVRDEPFACTFLHEEHRIACACQA